MHVLVVAAWALGASTEEPFEVLSQADTPPWSISRAIEQALSTSPRVDAQNEVVSEARASLAESRAGLLPRLDLLGQYTRLSEIDNDPLVALDVDLAAAQATLGQVADPAAQSLLDAQIGALSQAANIAIVVPQNQWLFRATVAYPVSALFFEILPGISAQRDVAKAREVEVDVVRNALALEVATAYFGHARARSAKVVAELSKGRAERDLAQAEAQKRNGRGSLPDVLRFRARLAEAEAELAQREAGVLSSATRLRALLHVDTRGVFAFEERLDEAPERDDRLLGLSVDDAFARRDELAVFESLATSQEAAASAALGDALPKFQVAAGVDYANPNLLFTPPVEEFRDNYTVSGILSWSIDGAYAATQRAEARSASKRQLEAQALDLRDQIRAEFERARTDYQAAFEIFAAAKRQSEAANEAYRARVAGYEAGLFDATSLIDSELDATRASFAMVDAGATLRVRYYDFARAAGLHLWELDAFEAE
ncbi:MAG: TolC family protein [Myxococcota bacterium]